MINRSIVTQPGLTLAMVINAFDARHPHADVAVAVGDALVVENVAGGNQLFLSTLLALLNQV